MLADPSIPAKQSYTLVKRPRLTCPFVRLFFNFKSPDLFPIIQGDRASSPDGRIVSGIHDVITTSSRASATSLGRQRQQPCRPCALLLLPPPGPDPCPCPSRAPLPRSPRGRRPLSLAGSVVTWLAVVLLVGQLPPPVHTRALAAEMLAVGTPLTNTTTTTTSIVTSSNTTTTPPFPLSLTGPSLGFNHSLDVLPQGDQPGPPFKEGTPLLPSHWNKSTNRTLYINNRYGKYLEMWPDGQTSGVTDRSSFGIFVLLSHISHLVMKGYVSNKFLCMNSTTSRLYTRTHVHQDCYISEAIRNGSGNIVYNYVKCRTPENKKCYLGMYRNGTMRLGMDARQSQNTAQWLSIPVPPEDLKEAADVRETIKKQGGWTPPTPPVLSTPKPISKREQRRKRVRRWCRNLTVIVKNSAKFERRCKHDCDALRKMIAQPARYMRRCLTSHVRRRYRNKASKKSGSSGRTSALDSEKIRARVRKLWPRREEIFQRLRRLRRCNRKRRQRGHKRHSCSKREIRREQRRRAKHRSQSKSSSTPSSGSPTERSRSVTSSRSSRHRIRHQDKKTGRRRRRKEEKVQQEDNDKGYESKSKLMEVLTQR